MALEAAPAAQPAAVRGVQQGLNQVREQELGVAQGVVVEQEAAAEAVRPQVTRLQRGVEGQQIQDLQLGQGQTLGALEEVLMEVEMMAAVAGGLAER